MREEFSADTILRWLVFPILILVFAFQAYACRGIYADGAHFFLQLLVSSDFPRWDPQRMINHYVTLGPTVLALKMGAHNLVFLRYLFSTWLLLCPLLVWGAALWNRRGDGLFWPFVLLFCFVYYSTNFFAIGEYNLCFALAAYCCAELIGPLPQGRLRRACLLVAAALLSFHYPSTLFHGTLLFLLVVIKPRDESPPPPPPPPPPLAFLFAGSVVTALWSVLLPQDPANFASARDSSVALHDVQFRSVVLYVIAGNGLFLARRPWIRYALLVLCSILLITVELDPLRLYVFTRYALRAYVALALALCGIGLWWFRHRFEKPPALCRSEAWSPAAMAMLLLVTLSWYDIQLSLDYKKYLGMFGAIVNGQTGLVPYERTGYPFLAQNERFKWIWIYPVMSVVLCDDSQKAILLNPSWYHGWQPFDPHNNVPNLDKYYR